MALATRCSAPSYALIMELLEFPIDDFSSPGNQLILPGSKLLAWAKAHFRYRVFQKDQRIPTRPGLLYFVHSGIVRITGDTPPNYAAQPSGRRIAALSMQDETFVNLVSVGQPFEVVAQRVCQVQAIAHTDDTRVFWLYWEDVDTWPNLRHEVMEQFRHQHQRLLLRLNAMSQRHTVDRILLFVRLLIEEHGRRETDGEFLPYALTHSQLASAVGTTRVTVTRTMGILRKRGDLLINSQGHLGLPLT